MLFNLERNIFLVLCHVKALDVYNDMYLELLVDPLDQGPGRKTSKVNGMCANSQTKQTRRQQDELCDVYNLQGRKTMCCYQNSVAMISVLLQSKVAVKQRPCAEIKPGSRTILSCYLCITVYVLIYGQEIIPAQFEVTVTLPSIFKWGSLDIGLLPVACLFLLDFSKLP